MNSSRCFKTLVAIVLVLTAVVAPVAAVSTSTQDVPDETQVGDEVSATVTVTELYSEYESWTLHGETNLTDVTWTVRKLDQAGNRVSQTSYDGKTFNESVNIENDTARIEIQIRGTTPAVRNFSYEQKEQFLLSGFELLRQGGTQQDISQTRVHYFTEDSKTARQAIERASATVEDSGDSEAEATLSDAIEAYNDEEFGSATTFAANAETQAQQAQNTQNRNRLLVYAVATLLVIALFVGGVLYWRSQQDSYDKLG